MLANARGFLSDAITLPNVSNNIDLANGEIRGLSTIYRSGKSHVFCSGKSAIIQVSLGFRNLSGSYKWHKKLPLLSLDGAIDIKVDDLQIVAKISQSPSDSILRLTMFDIVRLEGVKIHITGLGPLSWLFSKLSTFLVRIFRSFVANYVEGPIQKVIRHIIEKTKPIFPPY
ncbi:uncharacterized protein LOC106473512 [Limulus polyphemus]|uniref:Uncharacterized protein LOC106473512 n=1 Tax=Limulus polyphemus TaxID=6850 RepID=A0ABM1BVT8_LIMPO|nr:uncharacterized protein LOC106473512 [Limulus polyphemus]